MQHREAASGGLVQESELAEDLNRGFLEDIVGEIGASQAGDVASQRRIRITEKLFQCAPVAGLGEEHKESLVGWRGLLRAEWSVHA